MTSQSARIDQCEDPDAPVCLACYLPACIHDPDGDPEAQCPRNSRPAHGNHAPVGYISLTQAARELHTGAKTVRRWLRADGVEVHKQGHTEKSVLAVPLEWVDGRRRAA